jgi:hypothetical protein
MHFLLEETSNEIEGLWAKLDRSSSPYSCHTSHTSPKVTSCIISEIFKAKIQVVVFSILIQCNPLGR